MSGWIINPDSISVANVLRVMGENPGIRMEQLAALCGYTKTYTRKVLRTITLHEFGGCVPLDGVEGGRARGWYAGDAYPVAKAVWTEIAAKRAKEREQKRLHAFVSRQKEQSFGGAKPVQRRVSAKSKRPLPFRVKAVNSVFALGGGL